MSPTARPSAQTVVRFVVACAAGWVLLDWITRLIVAAL